MLEIYGSELKLKDFTLDDIADLTENFTSADIVALLKEARLKLANDLFENNTKEELEKL